MKPTKTPTAVAYYRTSSHANVGADKDSLRRQQEAVRAYAEAHGLRVVREFYDAAVSGADRIDTRKGFGELLQYMHGNGARTVLVENASRFARDLAVQLAGHDLLKGMGFTLVPVDAPDHFTDDTPTATMVRQILGAVSEFEKASLVAKLRAARERKRRAGGYAGGFRAHDAGAAVVARKLVGIDPATGKKRTLRAIAAMLADAGYVGPQGRPYLAGSIAAMLRDAA